MRLFLDSTYFFPLIGVAVTTVEPNFLERLIKETSHQLLYSSITLFELSAKGAKLVSAHRLREADVTNGLTALRDWDSLSLVDPWSREVQQLAFYFRKNHTDFIDCLLLASAVIYADGFVSEDEELSNLVDQQWETRIRVQNAAFQVFTACGLKETFEKG